MTLDPHVTIGFVGAGRLGASLAVAMDRVGYRVGTVSCREVSHAQAVADRIEGAFATNDPQVVVDASDVVFVATPDREIEGVAREIAFRSGHCVLHCSGATGVSALESALEDGARTGGFHPLQTFPDQFGQDRLSGVTFGIETGSGPLRRWLETLAHDLGGRTISLSEEDRGAYHASAVMACGLVAGLTGLAASMWRDFGERRETGLAALAPLLESTAAHVRSMGIPAGMTGPYVRGDPDVIRRHLRATGNFSTDIQRAYAALALAQLPIAAEQGNLGEEERTDIEILLRAALASLD